MRSTLSTKREVSKKNNKQRHRIDGLLLLLRRRPLDRRPNTKPKAKTQVRKKRSKDKSNLSSLSLPRDLVLELPAPNRSPASSSPRWIPALRHEIFNHSVENQSVVVSFLCQLEEILRRFRRVQVIQFQLYLSERGVEENSGRSGGVVIRVQSRGVLLFAHDRGVSLLNVVVVVSFRFSFRGVFK